MDVSRHDLTVVALHGFLGEPSDWTDALRLLPEGVRVLVPDYTHDPLLSPQNTPLLDWGHAFEQWCAREQINGPLVLLGYSQGGRLVLQALERMAERVEFAILVSTNPGLSEADPLPRETRWQNDERWARRFEVDEWSTVIADWNKQPVFAGGSAEPARSRPDGPTAAACLKQWSLAHQQDFRPLLRRHQDRVLWVVGEKDEKFLRQSKELKQDIPDLDVRPIKEAGHRVLFDQPGILGRLAGESILLRRTNAF